ncbi:MAG: hypothetical protein KGO05_04870 [Chloroflexota bacterium]|nr:hypothetical protein [Chloroflexota bacterium]
MAPDATARAARLRARLERRFALLDLAVPLAGLACPLVAALPADPNAPLDEMAARQAARGVNAIPASDGGAAMVARATVAAGAHLPYWALLWPSGLALAEALLATPDDIRGARTLELGCGLGVTAAVVLTLGARLTVSDLFGEALLFAAYNCLRCAGRAPTRLLLNWRTPAGRAALLAAAPYDTLLAADVLYEREDVAPLLALVPSLLSPGATFWLAEPGRKASRAFVAAALERGWRDSPTACERAWPPDGDVTRVVIHRFKLP